MKEVCCTHCQGTYNLGNVKTLARYADCTVFEAPCCGRTVDDRRWKSLPDTEEVWEPDPADLLIDAEGKPR